MCEKRTRIIKKAGSQATRLREARRMERLQRFTPSPTTNAASVPGPPTVDTSLQNRVILALAWKTMALMHKNRLIQQKIIDLQKETADFVRTIRNNPEQHNEFLQNLSKLKPHARQHPTMVKVEPHDNDVIKMEPDV